MKKVIRRSTFETNSSSTHSLTIMTQEKWDEFKTTDKWLADWDGELYLVDDLIKEMKEAAKNNPEDYKEVDLNDRKSCIEFLTESDWFTYDMWGTYEWSNYLECYTQRFETPSGDKMIAVGYYGYDG